MKGQMMIIQRILEGLTSLLYTPFDQVTVMDLESRIEQLKIWLDNVKTWLYDYFK
jgi:hypothetical protein